MTDREIDELVHHDVMGVARPPKGWSLANPIPHYSTDPAASKQLRDKMRADGWSIKIRLPHTDEAGACVSVDIFCNYGPCVKHGTDTETWHGVSSEAFTEEFAVSLAALCAVGVEVEGK